MSKTQLFPVIIVNPLSTNPTKRSNTLKKFVGNLPTNFLSVFDLFVGLALKGSMFWLLSCLRKLGFCGGNVKKTLLCFKKQYKQHFISFSCHDLCTGVVNQWDSMLLQKLLAYSFNLIKRNAFSISFFNWRDWVLQIIWSEAYLWLLEQLSTQNDEDIQSLLYFFFFFFSLWVVNTAVFQLVIMLEVPLLRLTLSWQRPLSYRNQSTASVMKELKRISTLNIY